MKCEFEGRDISSRLDSTVIRYQGHPYFCRVEGRVLNFYALNNINNRPVIHVDAHDDGVDISSIPLGYLQVDDKRVVFITRIPVRRYKQGVDANSLKILGLPDMPLVRVERSYVLFSKNAQDMILDQYLDNMPMGRRLDFALEVLRGSDEPMSMAINRNIALHVMKHKVINVYYKNELVGWMAPSDKVVHVPSDNKGWIVSKHLSNLGLTWEID